MTLSDDAQVRRRRRFAVVLLPFAIALIAAGLMLASHDGLVGALGLVALAQGIGITVAAAFLALGHNPLQRRRGGGSTR